MSSVVISSYKKNTDGAYHRHNWDGWTAEQRERRDAFNDASWAENFTQPRIPEGTVHLIIGDSPIRVLERIRAHWQGDLEFIWCGNAPDVGITRDPGDGKKPYGHPNDGDR